MEERMKILKLLEEGKITAEEAAKLLEAIKPDSIGKVIISSASNAVDAILSEVMGEIPEKIKEKMKNKVEKVKRLKESIKEAVKKGIEKAFGEE